MFKLYSNLKPFYEKFLVRGQSYGLSPHEIHDSALNLFIKFLSVIILVSGNEPSKRKENSPLIFQRIRRSIHEILFQKDLTIPQLFPKGIPPILYGLLELSHQEAQFKDSLLLEEWDALVELLLDIQWTFAENFDDRTDEKSPLTPEFLSYFYENIFNEFENFFRLTPKVSKRKHKGIFFTPWRIIREITNRCLDHYFKINPFPRDTELNMTILDPSCGTGSFLVYTAESILQRYSDVHGPGQISPHQIVERFLYGIDLSLSSLTVAKFRLLFWILNLNSTSIDSLPAWLFRNICVGNTLFGLYKERIQYPLDYSTVLLRINNQLNLEQQSNSLIMPKESWLETSFRLKEVKKLPHLNSSHQTLIQKAEEELQSLVDTFYLNWLRKRFQDYPRPAPLKSDELETVTSFHWGLAVPEVILNGGFDIVLGNPPYGRSILTRIEKSLLKLIYESCSGRNPKKYSLNAASAFIERSITILKHNGTLGLIVPFSILRVEEFETLRKFMLERAVIWQITDESAAFTDVTLEMCSIFLTKKVESDYEVTINPRPNIHAEKTVPVGIFKKYNRFMIYHNELWDKIESQGLVKNGIVSGDYGIDHRILKKDLSSKISRKYPICYLHSGRSVTKYALNPKYFQWSKPHPINERFTKYFREPRLVNTAIGNRFRVAYKPEKIVPGTNVSILEVSDSYHYFPMLVLLNSDLINYLLKRYILNFSHLTVYLHKYYTKMIPIKYPHEFEKEFTTLASYLLFLNQASMFGRLIQDKRTEYLQNLSNYLVYDLYFPEILGISSNLAVNVGKHLKPIDIDSFLDLIFFQESEADQERLSLIISSNWNVICTVTNQLRRDEEIRQHKKTLFQNKLVRQICKEL